MQEEIKSRLNEELTPVTLELVMNGNHCDIKIISDRFVGLSKVKRQQLVYACLNDKIASGEIHAVNIDAQSPDEL